MNLDHVSASFPFLSFAYRSRRSSFWSVFISAHALLIWVGVASYPEVAWDIAHQRLAAGFGCIVGRPIGFAARLSCNVVAFRHHLEA